MTAARDPVDPERAAGALGRELGAAAGRSARGLPRRCRDARGRGRGPGRRRAPDRQRERPAAAGRREPPPARHAPRPRAGDGAGRGARGGRARLLRRRLRGVSAPCPRRRAAAGGGRGSHGGGPRAGRWASRWPWAAPRPEQRGPSPGLLDEYFEEEVLGDLDPERARAGARGGDGAGPRPRRSGGPRCRGRARRRARAVPERAGRFRQPGLPPAVRRVPASALQGEIAGRRAPCGGRAPGGRARGGGARPRRGRPADRQRGLGRRRRRGRPRGRRTRAPAPPRRSTAGWRRCLPTSAAPGADAPGRTARARAGPSG